MLSCFVVPPLPLHAIVQLTNPPLRPRVSGQAIVPLQLLPDSPNVYTVPLKLGGKAHNFLLDTGASTTLIATPLLQQLRLRGRSLPANQFSFAIAGDRCAQLQASLVRLPVASLGEVKIQALQALQFNQSLVPEGAQGTLGMDVLGQFDLRLNPQQQQLQLSSPNVSARLPTGATIPLTAKAGVMLAQVELNQQGPFTVLVDTAAESTFISPTVADRLKLASASRQPAQLLGFCGLEPAEITRLEMVRMGDRQQANLEAVITNSSVIRNLGVDGVFGQNFLNVYEQIWQFRRSSTGQLTGGSLTLKPLNKTP